MARNSNRLKRLELQSKDSNENLAQIFMAEKNKAAQQLGRLGGRVTSEAKAKAAKENGKKGGRPRKQKP